MTIKQLDAWLRKENISSVELARFLGITKAAISKWRERKAIPKRESARLKVIVSLDRRSLQRHLNRQEVELF